MHFTCKVMLPCLLLVFSMGAQAANHLPQNHAVNGGVTIVPINLKDKPEVIYDKHRIAVAESPNPHQWLLVVGVPLDKTKAIQELEVVKPRRGTIPFHVSEKYYPTQYLTIKNQRKVDPYEKDRARIDNEQKRMEKIYAHYSKKNPFAESFAVPTHGPITSLFGLKRVYNKKPRSPHTGLDVGAPEGKPVRVISAGKVADVHDYFFTGNTVIVDHGMGVYSLYAHLQKTDVKTGQTIKKGDRIGTVGQTGRVTGPHLHWSMIMNETYVDPLLFVPAKAIRSPEKKNETKKS